MVAVIQLLLERGACADAPDAKGSAIQQALARRQRWADKGASRGDISDNMEDILGYCDAVIRLLQEA